MKKKAINKKGRNRKGRRAGLWAVSLIVSFQVLALILFSIATPVTVEAKVFTVTSTQDETDYDPDDGVCESASGYCTLRAAIQQANALAGPDTIKLNKGLYMLTIDGTLDEVCATGDLDITDDLTITGKGAKNTFINGGQLDRVFHTIGDISVMITNVTIQNGLATDNGSSSGDFAYGGAIFHNRGTLKITRCTLSNNSASANYAYGGGIVSWGKVLVKKSTISNNIARGINLGIGGGIVSNKLTVTGSTISNNIASGGNGSYGGGIYSVGTSTITKTTLSNNTAYGSYAYGGGICSSDITLTITKTTLSNNTVLGSYAYGGGIYSSGITLTLTITKTTLSNNTALGLDGTSLGGGIYIYGPGYPYENTLLVTGSTISNNTASGSEARGGGIYSSGITSTITKTTLSNNTAYGSYAYGGGIYSVGDTLIVQNRSKIITNLASTSCGGIYLEDGSISSNSKVTGNIPDNICD